MNFRRFNKYICTVGLIAAMSVTTMGAVISDVPSSHWSYEAVTDLEERGIMVLNSSGQFNPNQTMNYFEIADVIAKATGYVDVDIATNVTEEFKQQIRNNYEQQKGILEQYASKYSTWNSAYNGQIAYLLGRKYMSTTDLDKFITKTTKGETKNIITKEDLCIYIVRMLGKEKTATSTYKTTTFTDDSTLSPTTKPYVAYLKSAGIVKPDTAGKANGTMKVTKALCAKMVSDALKLNDTSTIGRVTVATTPTPTTPNSGTTGNTQGSTNPSVSTSGTYTIGSVIVKNSTEYYISLKGSDQVEHFYSFKAITKVTSPTGEEVPISQLTSGTTVNATIGLEGSTQYITAIQITNGAIALQPGTSTTPTTPTNPTNGTTPGITVNTPAGNYTTVEGTLSSSVSNGLVRLILADGSNKAYILADNCITILDGVTGTGTDKLSAGDKVTLSLENGAITKIVATSGNVSSAITGTVSTLTSGEVLARKFAGDQYNFTVKLGNVTEEIAIPLSASVTRNNKMIELNEVRVGDKVSLTRANGVVRAVAATGTRSTVVGNIKEIHLAQTSQLVVKVNNEEMTYTLGPDLEVYDNNTNQYTNVRSLHLGQQVTLLLESMEAVSIDVDKVTTTYNVMGTIMRVGRNYEYIDVLVDYDYVSGESKVYKRIDIPSNLKITRNGVTKSRSSLVEDADIVINYKYLDDTVPEKILIIS